MITSHQPGHDDAGGELFQASAQQALALSAQGERDGHAWVVLSVARLPDAVELSAHLVTWARAMKCCVPFTAACRA